MSDPVSHILEEDSFDVYANAVPIDERSTIPLLTKFERPKIIGVRMQQIARGAVPMVPTDDLKNTEEIVLKELEERKIPLIIKRDLPNGKYEIWRLDELTY